MSGSNIPLSQIEQGHTLRITRIDVEGVLRRRLLDLGFVVGNEIEVLRHSPLGDPTAFRVSNTTIVLRKEESSLIFGELIGGMHG